jgi:hypothetical protein
MLWLSLLMTQVIIYQINLKFSFNNTIFTVTNLPVLSVHDRQQERWITVAFFSGWMRPVNSETTIAAYTDAS